MPMRSFVDCPAPRTCPANSATASVLAWRMMRSSSASASASVSRTMQKALSANDGRRPSGAASASISWICSRTASRPLPFMKYQSACRAAIWRAAVEFPPW